MEVHAQNGNFWIVDLCYSIAQMGALIDKRRHRRDLSGFIMMLSMINKVARAQNAVLFTVNRFGQ